MSYLRTIIKKAGTLIGVRRSLNFIQGSNITLTMTDDTPNDRVNITIAASGGGGGSTIYQTEIDFGASTQTEFNTSLTVADASITATSKIILSIAAESTTDHSADEVMAERINIAYANLVAGVSFDIIASCTSGTWGKYKVNYIITY